MEWYWWIVIWVLLGVGVWAFIAGAHDDRFDERPVTRQHHPPDRQQNDKQKWW